MRTVSLREVAHARSGEKGRDSNISVIAYDEADYWILRDQVTVDVVRGLFGPITKGAITRYEAPAISALNFVLEDVLEGGRTRTLAFEESGKALSSLILTLKVEVPNDYVERFSRAREPVPSVPEIRGQGKTVRLGSASAWSRDRFEPAEALARGGDIDYLCFDAMSEITMSIAQAERVTNPAIPPYDPTLEERLEPILRLCKEKSIKIISNGGWLDPLAAADRIFALGAKLGLPDLKVAAVCGGILTDRIADLGLSFSGNGEEIAKQRDRIVSAEAYLGAEGIIDALRQGADVVITARVGDACLYLGPLAYEFGWDLADHERIAQGMVVGHLIECGAQVCGGYFADPGYKDVPGLDDIGNPIAEVNEDRIVITKLAGTGGVVSSATCKEQLLYEVQDPAQYLCPDVVVDFTKVSFRDVGTDRVEVLTYAGVGLPPTSTLKALVGLREGFMTEEMVLFAGPGALARAEMTKELLLKRFDRIKLDAEEVRFDYIGLNSVHREASPKLESEPYEVVLRIGLKARDRREAEKLRREVDPLAVNGVSGTGKWATSVPGSRVRPVIGLNWALVPRNEVPMTVVMRHLK